MKNVAFTKYIFYYSFIYQDYDLMADLINNFISEDFSLSIAQTCAVIFLLRRRRKLCNKIYFSHHYISIVILELINFCGHINFHFIHKNLLGIFFYF